MEQYRFDPYTGPPLPQARPASSRTWLSGVPQTPPTPPPQPPARQEQPGVIFRPVASFDEAKAVPTDFSGALTIMPDWAHGYIYAKALGDNGNPVFRAYRDVDYSPVQTPPPQTVAAPAPPGAAGVGVPGRVRRLPIYSQPVQQRVIVPPTKVVRDPLAGIPR